VLITVIADCKIIKNFTEKRRQNEISLLEGLVIVQYIKLRVI